MQRNASARWQGTLEQGKGTITTDSGVLSDSPYSFRTRFESDPGTNPEELIAGAHAGCFSMALSMILGQAGLEPESIDTRAEVTLDQVDEGFAITRVHLRVKAKIPGADRAKFEECAEAAKAGCPVSKVLNAEISMEAELEA